VVVLITSDKSYKNLEISFFGKTARVEALKEKLKLQTSPNIIEE
jgi:hypothetical protein